MVVVLMLRRIGLESGCEGLQGASKDMEANSRDNQLCDLNIIQIISSTRSVALGSPLRSNVDADRLGELLCFLEQILQNSEKSREMNDYQLR
jgi:hypothetical protein